MVNPFQSYGASPVIWDHTLLPATRRRWMRPVITSTRQTGGRFSHFGEMVDWVALDVVYRPKWFSCPRAVTNSCSKHLMASWPGVESTTSRSQVQRPNSYWCGIKKLLILTARLCVVCRWFGDGASDRRLPSVRPAASSLSACQLSCANPSHHRRRWRRRANRHRQVYVVQTLLA